MTDNDEEVSTDPHDEQEPCPMTYDSRADTLLHARDVGLLMGHPIKELIDRAQSHDYSKTQPPEKAVFDEFTPKLNEVEYDSPEYHANRAAMKPGLDHHYANNPHHPEFYGERGVRGMTLPDLIEMLCDWKARCDQQPNGHLARSLGINRERFNIPDGMYDVLVNTARHYGWIEPDEVVDVDPRPVDPERLVERLVANGWVVAGRRTGEYVRLTWPGASSPKSLSVPLDQTAPEYEEQMSAVLRVLRDAVDAGERTRDALDG